MQVKFIHKTTLDSTVINVKGATFDEILDEALEQLDDFNDKTIIKQNNDVYLFENHYGEIIYHGVPKSEQKRGRVKRDWTEEKQKFNEHYNKNLTAMALSIKSGLPVGTVYYLAKMEGVELAKGKRGRRK